MRLYSKGSRYRQTGGIIFLLAISTGLEDFTARRPFGLGYRVELLEHEMLSGVKKGGTERPHGIRDLGLAQI